MKKNAALVIGLSHFPLPTSPVRVHLGGAGILSAPACAPGWGRHPVCPGVCTWVGQASLPALAGWKPAATRSWDLQVIVRRYSSAPQIMSTTPPDESSTTKCCHGLAGAVAGRDAGCVDASPATARRYSSIVCSKRFLASSNACPPALRAVSSALAASVARS